MHASANWVSWQGTTVLLTALIEYLTGGRAQQAFGKVWALPGPPLATPLPTSLDPPLNLVIC